MNVEFRLPVTAGTDKMLNTQVAGSVRTYAHTGEETLRYDRWLSAQTVKRTLVGNLTVSIIPLPAEVAR